jgi:hypothetical protein
MSLKDWLKNGWLVEHKTSRQKYLIFSVSSIGILMTARPQDSVLTGDSISLMTPLCRRQRRLLPLLDTEPPGKRTTTG